MFKRTGSEKDWSIIDRISEINIPTLLISGKYDGVAPSTMQPFFDAIDKVKWVNFANSSHFPHMEEPEEFLKVLGGFLVMK
jgi:L-proline amide hydrolase